MSNVRGTGNYTIDGNNSQIGDNTFNIVKNIFNIFIINSEEVKENIKREEKKFDEFVKNTQQIKNTKNELRPFFDIGLLKTSFLDTMFVYFGAGLLFYLLFVMQLSNYTFIGFGIIYSIVVYWFHSWVIYRFVPIIYINEDRFSVVNLNSKIEYLYSNISLHDTVVNNNFINIEFIDGSKSQGFSFHKDSADLLKYRIEEYHHFYSGERD